MSSLIVAARDGLEALLARRVPDLQLDCLARQVERADLEVHADRGQETLVEDIVGESQQKGRLADGRVSDQQQLEQIIVILLECHRYKF